MKMRSRILLVLSLAIIAMAARSAALADGPVNPYRQEVERLDMLLNRFRPQAWITGVSFEEVQAPTMEQTGVWEIQVDQRLIDAHGDISRIDVRFQSPDPDGGYTTTFKYTVQDLSAPIESHAFVAPGEYQLVAFVYLSDGESYAGFETFEVPEDGIHPTRAEKVAELVAELSVPGDDWQTALNLHDWLISNAYYDSSYTYYGAEDVLFRGYGVCVAYSKAYQFMLTEAGITSVRVSSRSHAWNRVMLNGVWCYIDTTWDDPTGGPQQAVSGFERWDYFGLNEELLYGCFDDANGTHVNGSNDTGYCTSLVNWYPLHSGDWEEYGILIQNGRVMNYRTLMAEEIQAGHASFELSGDSVYPFNIQYSSGDFTNGYSYYSASSKTAIGKRIAFAAGLSANGLELDDGSLLQVDASYDGDSLTFSVEVLGWLPMGEGWLELPEELEEIGPCAFEGADAAAAVIPESCLLIGERAFASSSLQRVEFLSADTVIGEDAFDGCWPLMFIAPESSFAADYAAENGILCLQP